MKQGRFLFRHAPQGRRQPLFAAPKDPSSTFCFLCLHGLMSTKHLPPRDKPTMPDQYDSGQDRYLQCGLDKLKDYASIRSSEDRAPRFFPGLIGPVDMW